ncbi:unnamed protein product [Rhizoctonia solani]|uniref:Proteasome inhibitor PI31 subunit n=1 Tax=Rhizoctonia solani TaxID=456999 RepID=A0A8H3A0V1_9AGAM|nr:unnamed protein product [Rhizoctonia solani]
MANVLDASALLSKVPNLLSDSNKTLSSPQDAVAILLHSAMTALGFRLVAISEDAPARDLEAGTTPGLLPEDWNRKGPDVYTFKYRHEQSSFTFLLKLVKISGKMMVHGIAIEDDKTKSFEITTQDFTSASYFPHDVQSTDRPLVHGYISSSRVTDLISLFKVTIIQPLLPGLRKEGYQESESSTSNTSTASATAPSSSGHLGRGPPRNPSPPSLDRPFAHPYADPFRRNPLEIGRSDLDPLGGLHNPFAPPPLFSPPGAGGDGMFVGPNHPMFRDPLGQGMGIGGRGRGGVGPWGGDGFLPPMGAPPGARFDPIFPGPLGGRGGNPRQPPRSGDPDNDAFMPPGSHDSMYM